MQQETEAVYGKVFELKEQTPLANIKTKAYHLDRFLQGQGADKALDPTQLKAVRELEDQGYTILEDFLDPALFEDVRQEIHGRFQTLDVDLPVIANAKVDLANPGHKRIVDNFFVAGTKELRENGLTLEREDAAAGDYASVLERFKPSTLKQYIIPDHAPSFNLWLQPSILDIVEAYMGLRPYMVEAYSRRNFPTEHKVTNHYWHRDTNHPSKIVKAFIFFTDCDLNSGPHEYVAKSHRKLSLNGKRYYTEKEVAAYAHAESTQVVPSVVKKGTIILEDTRGLHRACIPASGYRDLGYAVFVPIFYFRRGIYHYYDIAKKTYENLSARQKAYITPSSIKP